MTKGRKFSYSLHPGFEMQAKMIAGMKEKTGRAFEEWQELVRESGFKDSKSAAQHLKREHGLGTLFAQLIAAATFGELEEYDPEGLAEAQYEGPKAALRPLYEKLMETAFGLGKDVRACPAKTMVPLYRNHVFAHVKPTTRTRIDLGLALGDTKAGGKLISTGGLEKGDRITHRIALSSPGEIDAEVESWLRAAYERDSAPKRSRCC